MLPETDLLKIGDFARLAGTNLRTLRYYEELGLLDAATRSRGGFRYYRRTDIHRVRMIRDLQELGLNLDRICALLSPRSADEPREKFQARVCLALEEQDRLLAVRLAAVEEQRRKVAQALHKIRECRHCTQVPGIDNNFCEPCSTTGEHLPDGLSALYR
jgi:DNA-binding transcriptional MerR regulator